MHGLRRIYATGIVATLLPKSMAAADPMGTCTSPTAAACEDTGALNDDSLIDYCDGTMNPSDYAIADAAVGYFISNTDLSGVQHVPCGTNTDVRFDDFDLPAGTIADWACNLRTGTKCNASLIRLDTNPANLPTFGTQANQTKSSLMHEVGHSVGLTHYKDADNDFPNPPGGQHDCMISGSVNNDLIWRTLNPHHISHINSVY